MKRTILSIFSLISISMFAQDAVNISQGENYANDVFVSMENGEVETVDATDWDIAFELGSIFSTGVRINDGQGVSLYTYPNSDIDGWDAIDTTGMSEWTAVNNDLTAWSYGAFNVSPSGDETDYSWGYYTGPPEHNVIGDSLYIIQLVDETYKKLRLDVLALGEWTFTMADINGGNETEIVFNNVDYTDMNYVYYSITNDEFIEREPVSSSWDLMFTRYFGETAFGMGATSGVLANNMIELAQVDGQDPSSANYGDATFVADDISIVGNDWKYLDGNFQWQITEDQCFFVKLADGAIYKVVFTSFEGSSTGNISYNVEQVLAASLEDSEFESQFIIYPNPTNGDVKIILDGFSANKVDLNIYSLQGKVVYAEQLSTSSFSAHNVATNGFSAGVYIVEINDGFHSIQQKLIIK